jgi:hypothetical protein
MTAKYCRDPATQGIAHRAATNDIAPCFLL